MKVAVAGGTGVVGHVTTEALACHRADGVVLARSKSIDLVTGNGLADALAGVGAQWLQSPDGPRSGAGSDG
jgi:nucleoside-diphosphate-sugar epimerase